MKIAFLLAANVHGGPNRVVSEMSHQLALKGHQVTVVVPLVPHWTYHRLVTERKRGRLFSVKHALKSVLKEGLRRRFRWVGRKGGSVEVIRTLLKSNSRRLGEQDWYVLSNNWYQAYEWDTFEGKADRVIQMAYHHEDQEDREAQDLARKAYGLPLARLTLSKAASELLKANGVATDGRLFLGIDPACFFAPKSKPAGPSLMMYWGLEPRKGSEVGLKALQEIRRRHPELPVLLHCQTERDPLPPGYESVRSLPDRELAEVLRRQAIYVYPSLREGFGLPPLEAMACGCAVVATKVGAIPEFAEEGKDALLVEPGDPEAIVRAVERLLSDPALRASLSAQAALGAQRFTWRKSADWFEKFLLERRRHG